MLGSGSNSAISSGSAAVGGIAAAGAGAPSDSGPSTDPQFGDVLGRIQSQYGARPEKPREAKKTLGKDDFLKIMITQMKHQDPSSPFKAEQMAAQMAQFATVEQLTNINQGLSKLGQAQQPVERMSMTNLIGKVVTIDRERFTHTENQSEVLNFNLTRDAADVRVVVMNDVGEVVIDKSIGPMKKGETSYSWDGNKENTLPAKAGSYIYRIKATDERGAQIPTMQQGQGKIIGISFEGSEPVFLVGDAKHQQKIGLKNIVRIESDGAAMSLEDQNKINANAQLPSTTARAFEFTKQMDPQAEQAKLELAKLQGQTQDVIRPEEKGFPNGLTETKEGGEDQ